VLHPSAHHLSPEPRTRNGKNLRARDAPFIVTVGI
jgi:hypothetical protein